MQRKVSRSMSAAKLGLHTAQVRCEWDTLFFWIVSLMALWIALPPEAHGASPEGVGHHL
jgi:hypothetical protein